MQGTTVDAGRPMGNEDDERTEEMLEKAREKRDNGMTELSGCRRKPPNLIQHAHLYAVI